jgi:hypothetical protein
MASNINPTNIDGTFPVAGQDNDSQGFRDNFTNISNNFGVAATEISDLQNKAVLTSALTGSTLNNNFNGGSISAVNFTNYGVTTNSTNGTNGVVTLDISTGNIQKIVTAAPVTLALSNTWQATGYASTMYLWLNITDVAHTVTLPGGVTIGAADIAGCNPATGVIKFDQVGHYMLQFVHLTDGQGTNLWVSDVSRNAGSLRDQNFYFNDTVSNTFFVGYGSNLPLAVANDSGQNVMSAFGSFSSASVGNLTLANVIDGTNDTGTTSGYNITAARGNLSTSTFTAVQSNDYLGYHNAVAYTGFNNSGNQFQQLATMAFYATGSNVAYGLGGNVAFYTAKDGDTNTQQHAVYQALGIENDQSTKVFGNLVVNNNGGSSSSYVPVTSGSKGSPGQFAWDATYFYICTATNTWKRVALNLTSW